MLNVQKKILDYLEEVENKLNKLGLPDISEELFNIDSITKVIEETELLIPVIGPFSSGKSSLINSFLGKDYLLVGITPETALATEIRYSHPENERIEAVKKDLSFDLYKVEDVEKIRELAPQYKFARLFIANSRLKEIEPLVLVDMPGFESPLDLHNQAIMEYINRGVHYIVLTSVEDGTLSRSMIRQLEDIQRYRRDFSIFLSKSDLRPPEDVGKIKILYQEQIAEKLDLLDKTVFTVDNTKGDSLKDVLAEINPEELFKHLFIDDLKDSYHSISGIINTLISSLTKSKDENEREIAELDQGIQSVVNKRDMMLEEVNERYSDTNVNSIINSIGKDLTGSIDELVLVSISQGQDALSSTISEIVRNSLISNLNELMTEIGEEVEDMFSVNLSSVEASTLNNALPSDFVDKIKDSSRVMLSGIQKSFKTISHNQSGNKALYKTVTTLLAVTTEIVAPVIEILIIFLPEIMAFFQKKRQEENVRKAILTNVIPAIKMKLRKELPKIFNQQVQELIKSISNKFEDELAKRKEIIAISQDNIKNKISDIDSTVALYNATLAEIKLLANDVVFQKNMRG